MPRVDTAALKARVDLLELASSDTQLRKVTASEYAGPCPLCGGSDRFHLDSSAGWWFCRQCHEKRGDVIEYAQWRYGLDFAGAVAALGGDGGAPPLRGSGKAQRPAVQTPAQTAPEPPAAAWQARAEAMVSYAEGQLWQNEAALAYLKRRGLSEPSIREARLGYLPKNMADPASRWGLEGKPVYLWQGWVIPCHMAGALWYVKVRQEYPGQRGAPNAKYLAVKGSHKKGAVYGLDLLPAHAADLVLCEGELNALILKQALEPVCAVLSVGDAGNTPGRPAMPALARARRVCCLLDNDQAGQQGQERLVGAFAKATGIAWPRNWPTHTASGSPYDVNDAHLDGLDLAEWIIPSVGPSDPVARGRWARWWVDYEPLDSAAAAVTGTVDHPANLMDPKLRLWLAVYAEYEALGCPDP